uniref:exodeoxyribonuclease VII small subunit n=1 Tax=Thaumasiovibrio occultus TaxID=1891184 RepID=UPI000B363ED2|nr:exodeoxyribonuclease VII small subunit [Thaumasiovibrio occultus]
MSNETSTYMENYNKLQQAANELSQQSVPDVDKIIPLVKQGSEAYTHCMSRIAEVERMLEEIEKKTNSAN